jgi:hypothetical protein
MNPQRSKAKRKKRMVLAAALLFLVLIVAFLSFDPVRTLASLKKVDDYPLYTMTWQGGYDSLGLLHNLYEYLFDSNPSAAVSQPACTLFSSCGKGNALYGRNLDWSYSPVLLLFADPSDAYASVTLVNIGYLGFRKTAGQELPSWSKRLRLLLTPGIPYEGINEWGLTIAVASVPQMDVQVKPELKTLQSLAIIRLVLDRAKNTEEAVNLMKKYNVNFTPGPPVHYLIADPQGHSCVIEYHEEGIQVLESDQPWQAATNFYLFDADDNKKSQCSRYTTASQKLKENQGKITIPEAFTLLQEVSLGNTQWSVVYDMTEKEIHVVLAKNFGKIHTFKLKLNKD